MMSRHFNLLEAENEIRLDNGLIGLEFVCLERDSGVFSLRGIRKMNSGALFQFQNSPEDPWWEMEWRDTKGFRARINSSSPARGDYHFETSETDEEITLCLRWQGISLYHAKCGDLNRVIPRESESDTVDVEVAVTLRRDDPFAYWKSSMKNNSSCWTLWQWTLPLAGNVHRDGADRHNDNLIVPEGGWGAYLSQPAEGLFQGWNQKLQAMYPSFMWPMQFLAFDNDKQGLYIGFHDPEAHPKLLNMEAVDGNLNISVDHFPENMTQAQPDFSLEHIVTGVFQGDWYDASGIYRDWALKQKWTRKGNIADRSDIPEWMREIVLWWCLSSGKDTGSLSLPSEPPIEDTADLACRLHERFPYRTGIHWYNWGENLFNTDFPDFLPAKPGFREEVERLRERGVTVMPYINARLADPNSPSWHEDGMEEHSAKRSSPRCIPEIMHNYIEKYPNDQLMVPMCSHTAYWQDKILDVIRNIRRETGVDAIYLDQVAAGAPPLCFDASHGHPLGGGAYGVTGYQDMLDKMVAWSEESGEGVALTTESDAEPFMAGVAAFLMWFSTHPQSVPIFPTVYGGYVLTFGRAFYGADLQEPTAFISKLGQMFTWGCQPGWIHSSVAEKLLLPEHETAAEYLDAVCRAFTSGRRYLTEGRMLRPPQPLSRNGSFKTSWENKFTMHVAGQSTAGRLKLDMPEVLCTLWATPDDSLALAMTNMSAGERTVRYRLEAPETGITMAGRYRLRDTAAAPGEFTGQ
ncbi:MAG: DUF6259 domain-containing protein, partial [bacterium]|nr:DUF6259 domain-containing protein [bacterium]